MRASAKASSSKKDLKLPRGNCYAASEALYHLLGGKAAGWKPMRVRIPGDTHWFLKHESGLVLDVTQRQFLSDWPDYDKARGSGFLTKQPSLKAQKLIHKILWQ